MSQPLQPDVALFNEFHVLIVEHAKRHCRTKPAYAGYSLRECCHYIGNSLTDIL